MRARKNRYAEMERSFGLVLLLDVSLFVFYLMAAANGIGWLKVILFTVVFLISILCLALLYYAGEFGRQRSMWLVTAAAVIAICVLFSLILKFPSPNPYKQNAANAKSATAATVSAVSDTQS